MLPERPLTCRTLGVVWDTSRRSSTFLWVIEPKYRGTQDIGRDKKPFQGTHAEHYPDMFSIVITHPTTHRIFADLQCRSYNAQNGGGKTEHATVWAYACTATEQQ